MIIHPIYLVNNKSIELLGSCLIVEKSGHLFAVTDKFSDLDIPDPELFIYPVLNPDNYEESSRIKLINPIHHPHKTSRINYNLAAYHITSHALAEGETFRIPNSEFRIPNYGEAAEPFRTPNSEFRIIHLTGYTDIGSKETKRVSLRAELLASQSGASFPFGRISDVHFAHILENTNVYKGVCQGWLALTEGEYGFKKILGIVNGFGKFNSKHLGLRSAPQMIFTSITRAFQIIDHYLKS